jgi:cytidine deaminase
MKKNEELLSAARKARRHAYSPYSELRVGAAALTAAG